MCEKSLKKRTLTVACFEKKGGLMGGEGSGLQRGIVLLEKLMLTNSFAGREKNKHTIQTLVTLATKNGNGSCVEARGLGQRILQKLGKVSKRGLAFKALSLTTSKTLIKLPWALLKPMAAGGVLTCLPKTR